MSEAKGWLNAIPVIPLTDAVPVRFLDPQWEDAVVSSVDSNGDCDHWWRCCDGHGDPGYRVNLAHRQGFGYALAWFDQHNNWTDLADRINFMRPLLWGWVEGKTTDADRLALAQAMREAGGEE